MWFLRVMFLVNLVCAMVAATFASPEFIAPFFLNAIACAFYISKE